MSAEILGGKRVADELRHRLSKQAAKFLRCYGRAPRLDVVLVGDDPASKLYVGMKGKACAKVGLDSVQHNLKAGVSRAAVLDLVKKLNQDKRVDGILVQLPLPGKHSEEEVIQSIDPGKDADGLHYLNTGRLWSGSEGTMPCTPAGIMEILDYYKCELKGKRAVIIGRSNIVGKPMAAMLLRRHATVTFCHTRTVDLKKEARSADLLIVAAGQPAMVGKGWVKRGAVVVDVGSHKVNDKVIGDVDFPSVVKQAKAITPVPGGVGPMTITMLLANTVKLAFARAKAK